MVRVACFGVRISVTFHLMFVHIFLVRFVLLSGHLLGKSCSLGSPFVLCVFLPYVILVISRLAMRVGFGFCLLQFLIIVYL